MNIDDICEKTGRELDADARKQDGGYLLLHSSAAGCAVRRAALRARKAAFEEMAEICQQEMGSPSHAIGSDAALCLREIAFRKAAEVRIHEDEKG